MKSQKQAKINVGTSKGGKVNSSHIQHVHLSVFSMVPHPFKYAYCAVGSSPESLSFPTTRVKKF